MGPGHRAFSESQLEEESQALPREIPDKLSECNRRPEMVEIKLGAESDKGKNYALFIFRC